MESTKRLRDWLQGRLLLGDGWNELNEIADNIEREVEAVCDERDHWMELAHQWEDGASTRRFAERLELAASERADVTIFDVDYTPKKEHDMLEYDKAKLDELTRASVNGKDVDLWGRAYTALPLDADGIPIHVGDVMEWPDCSTAEVVGIGDDRFFYADDGLRYAWASDKIHHHATTVEDLLREFAESIKGQNADFAELVIAEFAAKLRLAGDE